MGRQHTFAYLILVSLAVLAVTMMPSAVSSGNKSGKVHLIPFHHNGPALACLVSQCDKAPTKVRATLIDLFGNIGLLVPFGALVGTALEQKKRATWARILLVLGAGILFSTFIETTQFWLPTRSADVDDVIFNSIGALLGALSLLAYRTGHRRASYWWQSMSTSLVAGRLIGARVPVRYQQPVLSRRVGLAQHGRQ